MSPTDTPVDGATAPWVSFEDFRDGLPLSRFRVIVNPALAGPFVAQLAHAIAVSIALLGCGIATALAGYLAAGAVLVATGMAFRRVMKWQAPRILLHLASRNSTTYYAATQRGVMEVRRA